MYKQSYYTITQPIAQSKGSSQKIIIFSTRTSEALVLDELTYHRLCNNLIDDIDAEMRQRLIDKKFIVPLLENELSSIIQENKDAIANETLLYEVIQPSAMCQLGCDYCGQAHAKHNTSDYLSGLMVQRIKDKLQANNKFKGLKIGWFGGEPLMALKEIRKLTVELKKLCQELNISYSAKMVTNGLSLKENIFVELAKDLNINQVEITLDGTEEFHDKRRHTKEGGASYQYIIKNILDIVNRDDFHELGCTMSIRCNVDKRNYEGVTPLIQELARYKLQDKISHFYVASVYSWGNDAHLKSFTKEEFAEMEIDWIIEMYKHGFQPFLYPGRVRSVCLAVSPNSEMYDAYGNIFNCTEVSYVPVYENTSYVLGNLKDSKKTVESDRPHNNWNDQILNDEFQCHSCKMLPVCGGGCPKRWHEGMAACPTPKFNIKERLILSYLHAKKGIKELAELADSEKV